MAAGSFADRRFRAHGGLTLLAVLACAAATLSNVEQARPEARPMTTSDALGANARQAMIDIFRKKDATAVDRHFAESFVQHDPNLADGLAGMRSLAAEIASSPAADLTIYRTLVDGDFVLLHSRYEGVARYAGPAIARAILEKRPPVLNQHVMPANAGIHVFLAAFQRARRGWPEHSPHCTGPCASTSPETIAETARRAPPRESATTAALSASRTRAGRARSRR